MTTFHNGHFDAAYPPLTWSLHPRLHTLRWLIRYTFGTDLYIHKVYTSNAHILMFFLRHGAFEYWVNRKH